MRRIVFFSICIFLLTTVSCGKKAQPFPTAKLESKGAIHENI